MDRTLEICKFIEQGQRGIEIAPWAKPILPRSQAYDTYVLDIFGQDELRKRAVDCGFTQDLIDRIEDVDFVGSAVEIESVVASSVLSGYFDYIISSHNFEHLPNPIKFLQGCQRVLRPGGVLSMAIPDRRLIFDYFRPVSCTGDFLEAFFEDRSRPSLATIFEERSLGCMFVRDGRLEYGFGLSDNPAHLWPMENLESALDYWQSQLASESDDYFDCHCLKLTPAALELILRDLIRLDYLDFELIEVVEGNSEFFVHLRNKKPATESREDFYARRAKLMRRTVDEVVLSSERFHDMKKKQSEYEIQREQREFEMQSKHTEEMKDRPHFNLEKMFKVPASKLYAKIAEKTRMNRK